MNLKHPVHCYFIKANIKNNFTTVSIFSDSAMSGEEVRAPVLWQRPHAKIYNYNQELGGSYYQVQCRYLTIIIIMYMILYNYFIKRLY